MEYNNIERMHDECEWGFRLPIIKYCSFIYEIQQEIWKNTNLLPLDDFIYDKDLMTKKRKYGFILYVGITIIRGEEIIL